MDAIGVRFGKYELLGRIGVGGMAEVFVAKTHGAEGFVKQLVIKRILPAFSEDPVFVRMFINEAHLAARLQHANIVQIFDFDHVDDAYYIAMEWIDGSDLRRIGNVSLRRQMPIPVKMAVHVGAETLKGLHYAHSRAEGGKPMGLVHRDISPHNLLVSFSGEVKIADFGIAKVAAIASATKTGAVKGKLPYMAPEQVGGKTVDARTDIFALGVVLWELIAGRRLYPHAGSEGELLAEVQRAEIPPLRAVNPDVSADLEQTLARMVAPDPAARYQSAAEALGDLGHSATVNDALVVSDYLRRLMPAESARDQRGQTRVVDEPSYEEAPPGAVTRTSRSRLEQHQALTPTPSPAAARSGLVEQSRASGSFDSTSAPTRDRPTGPPLPQPGEVGGLDPLVPRQPRRRTVLLIGATAILAASGALGGWFIGAPAESQRPVAAPAVESARVIIDSRPNGASVRVDGVELDGVTPLTFGAAPGRILRLTVRRGAMSAETSVTLHPGARKELLLQLQAEHSPATAATPRQPDAAAGVAAVAAAPGDASLADPARRRASSERPASRRAAASRKWGKLNVVVAPWAQVKVDGARVGTTPIRDHRIAAGRHRLELSNGELGRREKLKVNVGVGESVTVRRAWGP